MTKGEQWWFVEELVRSVSLDIESNLDKIPAAWDGFELRQYVADKFAQAVYRKMEPRRKRAYNKEVLNRNL
jgi:TATA-box binding protein (TBP) (component of TFIID and TFIIIB)